MAQYSKEIKNAVYIRIIEGQSIKNFRSNENKSKHDMSMEERFNKAIF